MWIRPADNVANAPRRDEGQRFIIEGVLEVVRSNASRIAIECDKADRFTDFSSEGPSGRTKEARSLVSVPHFDFYTGELWKHKQQNVGDGHV